MTSILFIRHGVTDWNVDGLIQGSTDVPLGEAGRREVAAWHLPDEFKDFDLVSSPLRRAYETARILTGTEPRTDNRLAEMCWGAWEGRTLPDLREELGNLMTAWEAKGLDFRGPGGESPREVQDRMRPFLREVAAGKRNTMAVCHKGVIRAMYALATGWEMLDKPPEKLRDGCAHMFRVDGAGGLRTARMNIPLTVSANADDGLSV